MTKAQSAALADQLNDDAKKGSPQSYHNHVMLAIINGLSDEEIRAAIEKGKAVIIKNITDERIEEGQYEGKTRAEAEADVAKEFPEWEEHEMDGAKAFASLQEITKDQPQNDDDDSVMDIAAMLGLLNDEDDEDEVPDNDD